MLSEKIHFLKSFGPLRLRVPIKQIYAKAGLVISFHHPHLYIFFCSHAQNNSYLSEVLGMQNSQRIDGDKIASLMPFSKGMDLGSPSM